MPAMPPSAPSDAPPLLLPIAASSRRALAFSRARSSREALYPKPPVSLAWFLNRRNLSVRFREVPRNEGAAVAMIGATRRSGRTRPRVGRERLERAPASSPSDRDAARAERPRAGCSGGRFCFPRRSANKRFNSPRVARCHYFLSGDCVPIRIRQKSCVVHIRFLRTDSKARVPSRDLRHGPRTASRAWSISGARIARPGRGSRARALDGRASRADRRTKNVRGSLRRARRSRRLERKRLSARLWT
jgi:hypothetical protein